MDVTASGLIVSVRSITAIEEWATFAGISGLCRLSRTMAFRAAAELRKMGALSQDDDVHSEFTKFKAECRNDARTSKGGEGENGENPPGVLILLNSQTEDGSRGARDN